MSNVDDTEFAPAADPLRPAFEALTAATDPLAKLKALKRAAADLATPIRHGMLDLFEIEERLIDLADSHSLVAEFTLGAIEQAVATGLRTPALREEPQRGNGHAADRGDEPPPPNGPADYGARSGGAPAPAQRERFPMEMLDEIVIADDPVELVRGIMPMGPALGVVFGPPKSLKSFMLNHVCLHVAADREYCGRAVQGGAVVYVTSEGVRGVKRRLIAGRRALVIEGKGVPFALVSVMPNLGAGADDRVALQREIAAGIKRNGITAPLRIIALDTLRRAMPGKSENEQKDLSVVIDNCEALARAFDCLVVLVHHSPRSDDNRGSGSNALDAAADLMIAVSRDEATGVATASVVRFKDGEEGDTWRFALRRAEVGFDRDGVPIASCHVEVTEEPVRKAAAKANAGRLSAAQQRVYDILVGTVAEAGVSGLAGEAAPRSVRAITRDQLKAHLKQRGWWDPDDEHGSRSKFSARLNELAGKRIIGLTAEHVWPVGRSP